MLNVRRKLSLCKVPQSSHASIIATYLQEYQQGHLNKLKLENKFPCKSHCFILAKYHACWELFLVSIRQYFVARECICLYFCWTNWGTCILFVLCWMNSNSSANTFSTSIVCRQTLETLLYHTQGSSSRGELALNGGFFLILEMKL